MSSQIHIPRNALDSLKKQKFEVRSLSAAPKPKRLTQLLPKRSKR